MQINKHLNILNNKQLLAVKMPRVPVLMLAGPGTGKTRTLVTRILYQIDLYKIPAEQILALTFSNKASREMNTRLESVLKEKAKKVKTCTIHSLCLEILRKYNKKAYLDEYFSICDESYQSSLLTSLVSDKVRNGSGNTIRGIQTAISQYMMYQKPMPPFSAMIYDQYIAHLKKHKLIDFNQIIVKTRTLLMDNKDICDQYAFLYQAIHVDEFQDTDLVQYDIIKMLSQKHKNIFVVADDDQSIYAWRGANPENINTFIKDFNIKEPLFLDINYRSGQKIIDTANSVVERTERIEPDKILKAGGDINDSVQSQFFDNEEQEINFIFEKINDWRENNDTPLKEIAVLYPRHVFAEKLSLRLLIEKIPFQQATGRNFSEDPLMKKVLLYLQIIRDPFDALILQDLVEIELGYNLNKQIQNLQNVLKCGYRKALYQLSNLPETNDALKSQLEIFIGNLANLINLKTFYNFEQLLQLILNGLQTQDKSYIEEKALNFSEFFTNPDVSFFKEKNKIWVYHENAHLRYIAQSMLSRFKDDIFELKRENKEEIGKRDKVILLTEFNLPVKTNILELYNTTIEKRESSFSSLVRFCQNWIVGTDDVFKDYVVFDLETTGRDIEKCGIVEIAAIRVRNKEITDSYQILVNPGIAIEKEAQEIHHISNEDIANAPHLEEIWKEFKTFLGDDILIAHNGYAFDFKIIDRFAHKIDNQKINNVRYDSLIFARQMFPNDRNSIDALADKYNLDPGKRHRALDDVKVLHLIFQKLINMHHEQKRKTSGDYLFEYCALANFIDDKLTAYEDKVLFLAGVQKLLSPFSSLLDKYCKKFLFDKDDLMGKLSHKAYELFPDILIYNNRDDFKNRLFAVASDFISKNIDRAIAEFLSLIMLINPQDTLSSIDAVSLLTFHSAKGLEFKKVIIMGMEDDSMPSFHAYKEDDFDDRSVAKKIDEQKRLLYVGLTRAKEEIILTAVKNRFGRIQKSSPFLREILNYMKENT